MSVHLLLAAALAAAPSPPSQAQMDAAFTAAFGAASPVVRNVERPDSSGLDGNPAERVRLTLRPLRLTALGGGRYALLVAESDRLGAHANPSALAVAYLREANGAWRLEHAWPEMAWTGNFGEPADGTRAFTFTATPTVLVSSSHTGQGETLITDWALAYRPDGPLLLGAFPAKGSLEPGACPVCRLYAYRSTLSPPHGAGGLFSIRYNGWTSPPDRLRAKVRFSTPTDLVENGGALVPVRRISLPGDP
jgi:hypothetical protein